MKTKNQQLSWSAAILLVLGLGLTPTAFAQDDLTKELNTAIKNIVEKHKKELAEQRAESDRRVQELEREAAQLRDQVAELRGAMERMRRSSASESPSRPERPATGVEVAPSGAADRPFLGVALAPASEEHLKKLGIERGIQVTQVVPDTPAQRVGLKADDVITSVGGKPVDFESFSGVLAGSKAGDRVALEYSRLVDNQPVRFEARVKLGRRGDFVPSEGGEARDDDNDNDDDDNDEGSDNDNTASAAPADPVKLGARVRQEAENNLVIVDVTAGSNAAEAGLREGDQLVSIGDARMATIDTVKEALGQIKSGQTKALAFRRDGNVHQVKLRWGAGSTKPSLLEQRVDGGSDRAPAAPKPPAAPKKRGFLGVALAPASEE
ncbi:MAG: PDZ domain-containing protein, partial [Planctomycetota bacterium]